MNLTAILLSGVIGLAQGTLLILAAPGVVGLLRTIKAQLQLRQGAGVLQPYRDLFKLLRKPAVRSNATSWIFASTPSVLFVAYSLLVFMVPVVHPATLISGDFVLAIYVLGLARFSLSLAGLDTGTPFGGLGSSREMFFHFLTEIGLVLVVVGLMIHWNTIDVQQVFEAHWRLGLGAFFTRPELLLLTLSLALLVLFESERIPIDNPSTHLELTMAHKAILLEYAGRDLALVEWAEMIKLTFLLTLLGNLFLPFPSLLATGAIPVVLWSVPAYGGKMVLLVLLLALWELGQPKLRLREVVAPGFTAMLLSLVAIIYTIYTTEG
ncbi:MAG: formate hydrogenlyase [Chloroflexaceae bacterium]|nr:formate hydrogenlyase [Chloroflexaceae bacterium]